MTRPRRCRSRGSGRFPLKFALARGGRVSDPHGVVLPRVAARTMTALTAPGSIGHPAAFSGRAGEFQELSLGNPTYLFRRSPPLTTYASHFRGYLRLHPCCGRLTPARLQRLTPPHPGTARHHELIPCLLSLQHGKAGLVLGLRSFPARLAA